MWKNKTSFLIRTEFADSALPKINVQSRRIHGIIVARVIYCRASQVKYNVTESNGRKHKSYDPAVPFSSVVRRRPGFASAVRQTGDLMIWLFFNVVRTFMSAPEGTRYVFRICLLLLVAFEHFQDLSGQ
jgi:hypothetical protein